MVETPIWLLVTVGAMLGWSSFRVKSPAPASSVLKGHAREAANVPLAIQLQTRLSATGYFQ